MTTQWDEMSKRELFWEPCSRLNVNHDSSHSDFNSGVIGGLDAITINHVVVQILNGHQCSHLLPVWLLRGRKWNLTWINESEILDAGVVDERIPVVNIGQAGAVLQWRGPTCPTTKIRLQQLTQYRKVTSLVTETYINLTSVMFDHANRQRLPSNDAWSSLGEMKGFGKTLTNVFVTTNTNTDRNSKK